MTRFAVSPANFYDWQRSAHSFERMALFRFREFTLTGSGSAEAILAGAVGAGFFESSASARRSGGCSSTRRMRRGGGS